MCEERGSREVEERRGSPRLTSLDNLLNFYPAPERGSLDQFLASGHFWTEFNSYSVPANSDLCVGNDVLPHLSELSALSSNGCLCDEREPLIAETKTSSAVDSDSSFRYLALDGFLRFRHPAVQAAERPPIPCSFASWFLIPRNDIAYERTQPAGTFRNVGRLRHAPVASSR